ncbi:MAG: tRNA guanosine(34) transglycosylase Tgt [Planctomycetota bacterium]|nr:MAG: tRNA guanosine(34) transglycosylase Tgt [Planctomycetota bacterium]
MSLRFELLAGGATGPRLGLLHTPHGSVATPAFLPVATRGMLRGIAPDRLAPLGVQIVLSNAFHLFVRPGTETVAALGGIHRMLAWDGPVLTDSGGFQVFSLGALARVRPDGVDVEDPVHGGRVDWTPRRAFETQAGLGPDVAMVLDVCPAHPQRRDEVALAVERTLAWAREQRELHAARGGAASGQALFGIVQGGVHADLREACARGLTALDFDGYAVGGVGVGEPHAAMMHGVEISAPHLPAGQVRYLMGVGAPLDLVESVARGMDMFDCVFPTRTGRFATALTRHGRLHLLNARFSRDPAPIEPGCPCPACVMGVPRGAIRAGFKSREMLPPILVSLHNVHFIVDLLRRVRASIGDGSFEALRAEVRAAYGARVPPAGPDGRDVEV